MNLTVKAVKRLCSEVGAYQAAVVTFDADGRFLVEAYGPTRERNREMKEFRSELRDWLLYDSRDCPAFTGGGEEESE